MRGYPEAGVLVYNVFEDRNSTRYPRYVYRIPDDSQVFNLTLLAGYSIQFNGYSILTTGALHIAQGKTNIFSARAESCAQERRFAAG